MALDAATITTYISDAETALHSLAMGDKIVTISNIDGGSATYNQTSMKSLRAYISYLEEQLARINGTLRRGPIEFST